jgi:hypothetical protein
MNEFTQGLVIGLPLLAFAFFAGCAIKAEWRKAANQVAFGRSLDRALGDRDRYSDAEARELFARMRD